MPEKERYLKDLMQEQEITYGAIAQAAGCRTSTAWQVVNNVIGSKRILGIVAEMLNISTEEARRLLPPNAA